MKVAEGEGGACTLDKNSARRSTTVAARGEHTSERDFCKRLVHTLLVPVNLERNLLAEISGLLTSQRCIPVPSGLEHGFKPFSLQTLSCDRRILGPQGRQLLRGNHRRGRRGEEHRTEAVLIVAEEGTLGERRERLLARLFGRRERDGNLRDGGECEMHGDATERDGGQEVLALRN